MSDIRPADHAMGLELQIEELLEQQKRALIQDRTDDADGLAGEIASLQYELAVTAERATEVGTDADPGPHLHHAEELNIVEEPG